MIDKTVPDASAAVSGIPDGAVVMIGAFGRAGQPVELIDALIDPGAGDLTIVNTTPATETRDSRPCSPRRVRKIICSFPRQHDSWVFDRLYRAGEIELEIVPQGNLAERGVRRQYRRVTRRAHRPRPSTGSGTERKST